MLRTICSILLICWMPAFAGEFFYVETDFEDGTLAGADQFRFGTPEVIESKHLDGKSLGFHEMNQLRWLRTGEESAIHCVGFDYHLESGARLIQYLDVPKIIRLDSFHSGTHRIDVYYDLVGAALSFIDEELDLGLLTIMAWSTPSVSRSLRIALDTQGVEAQHAILEIDNLVWKGGVEMPGSYTRCS